VQQGLDAGLGRKRMRGRDLARPFRGIRASAPPAPPAPPAPLTSILELCRAYQQRIPEHAFFCGPTAAAVMRVPLPVHYEQTALLHVAVPVPHRAPSGRGIVGHTVTVTGDAVRRWNGIQLSSPERVWCELGAILNLPDLVAAGDFLIHWRLPLTTRLQLQDAVVAYRGRRGKPRLTQALGLLDDRAESPQESRLRVIVVQGGIPGLSVNLPVTTSGGFSYRGDLAIPSRKMIIEYQGDYHRDPVQYRRDMTRVSRLEADGWYVMLVNADDLRDPAELVQRIRTVLATRPVFNLILE
jgi:very-short-patch-repair endonuclease